MFQKRKKGSYLVLKKENLEVGERKRSIIGFIWDHLFYIIIIIFSVYGSLFGLLSSIQLGMHERKWMIALVLMSIVLYAVLQFGKYFWLKFAGAWVIALGIGYFNRKMLLDTARFLANVAIAYINVYYEKNYSLTYEINMVNIVTRIIWFFVYVIFLLVIIQVSSCKSKAKVFFFIPSGLFFAAPFLVGLVPMRRYVCAYAIAILTALAKTGTREEKLNASVKRTVFITSSIVCLVICFVYPRARYEKEFNVEKIKKEFQKSIKEVQNGELVYNLSEYNIFPNLGFISGGLNDGQLGNTNDITIDGKIDLEVDYPFMPGETIYLRSYIGESYRDKRWGRLSKEDKDRFKELQEKYGENLHNLTREHWTLFAHAAGQNNLLTDQDRYMNIKRVDIDKRHALIPYNTYDEVEVKKGFIYTEASKESKDYKVSYNHNAAYLMDSAAYEALTFSDVNYSNGEFLSESVYGEDTILDHYLSFLEKQKDYEDFVGDVYTRISKDVAPRFLEEEEVENLITKVKYLKKNRFNEKDSFYINDQFNTVWGLKNEIDMLLAGRVKYKLSPGLTPRDQTFIDYFVLDNGIGNCTNFATTYAVLFRMCGFPTRYVEGYAVPSSLFKRVTDEDIYRAKVTDKYAHAWIEVYINHFGWMPVEVTPASEDSTTVSQEQLNQMPSRQPTHTPAPSPSPVYTKRPSESFDVTTNNAEKDKTHLLKLSKRQWIILTTVSFAVIIILVLVLHYQYIKHKRKKLKQSQDYDACVHYYYKLIIRVLNKLVDLDKNLDIPDQLSIIFEEIPILNRDELKRFIEIMQKLSYGCEQISEEECIIVVEFYENVYNYLIINSNCLKKLLFGYVKVL